MNPKDAIFDRRDFFKGSASAAALLAAAGPAVAAPLTEKEKLARIASNTWPLRYLFKSRMGFGGGPKSEEMKKKYGEITLLDFPQFTKDTFPGVTHMDLFSGLFGDVADDAMYVQVPLMTGVATRTSYEFDPSSGRAESSPGVFHGLICGTESRPTWLE
jgi:TAT (twin-arginine translocation) pathway signal sequence